MEKEIIGNCTLYHGDCYDVMREIETDSVALIHSDPPYDMHSEKAKQNERNSLLIINAWKNVADAGIVDGFDYSIFKEWERVLKVPNYQLWCSKKQFADYLIMAIQNGWTWQDIMLYRNNPIPSTNGKFLDKDYCIMMWKGRKLTGDYCDKATDYHWNIGGKKEWNHPTMKPLEPTEHLIKVGSDEGDLVLDPFMGSGTTGEACINTNRRFIGVELSDKFFDMACERLRLAEMNKNNGLW